jgi:hypothetical protein
MAVAKILVPPTPLSELSPQDQETLEVIKEREKALNEAMLNVSRLQSEISFYKRKLSISWIGQINYCLGIGEGFYALKTPVQITDCIAISFGITASREMKNNVSTSLSTMYSDKKLGRISINGKNYYGLPKYFNDDFETLKPEYGHLIEGRKRTP